VTIRVSFTINPMLPLTISPGPGALPDGAVGSRYNRRCYHHYPYPWCLYAYGFNVSAAGGVWPYVFSWADAPGSHLPPGLSMGSDGLINGTPTMAGTYNFLVTVADSESPPKHASATYSIAVAAPSPSPSPSPSP
jgi:hypothetical protein